MSSDPGPVSHAFGGPVAGGRYRARPEDFVVEELLGFEPSGGGPHLFLCVEKRGQNTEWVARQLARAAGVRPRDVGYSGLKDRHAVTRQWFSLPVAGDWRPPAIEGVDVLEAVPNQRKLRRGSHRANRFELRLIDCEYEPAKLEARLGEIAARGIPNAFGPQRYGRDGSNLAAAREALSAGPGRRPPAWHLSVARSYLFDRVLQARVARGDWDRPIPGDRMILDGSRSHFAARAVDEALLDRARRMDIHPSGPLCGRGGDADGAQDEAAEVEREALAEEAGLVDDLVAMRIDAARRPLRAPVRDLGWSLESDRITLRFELPPGAYATEVLAAIGGFEDATVTGAGRETEED